MKIIVGGGTGFIGTALVKRLLADHHGVTILTRRRSNVKLSHPQLSIEEWNAKDVGPWSHRLEGSDAVINLSGELIAGKRWTTAQKQRILETRTHATRAVVSAIAQAHRKPRVLVSASGVGYYGHVEAGDVLESSPKGKDFLADVCDKWEHEALQAEKFGVRVVLPRFGVVLGDDGGALPKLLLPFKLFAGGWLGNGRQWFPWVHRDDVIGIILHALSSQSLAGPINVAAPEPLTNKEFCKALGEVMGRPCWAPAPSVVLRIALGEMADMLLTGQKVIPQAAQRSGYHFRYPNVSEALRDVLH